MAEESVVAAVEMEAATAAWVKMAELVVLVMEPSGLCQGAC